MSTFQTHTSLLLCSGHDLAMHTSHTKDTGTTLQGTVGPIPVTYSEHTIR